MVRLLPYDGAGSQPTPDWQPAYLSSPARFPCKAVLIIVAALLLSCSSALAAMDVCDAQCQIVQAAALSRLQAGLLGPGQDPSLLSMPPGVAAGIAEGTFGTPNSGPGVPGDSGGSRGPPSLPNTMPPGNSSLPAQSSMDMPLHCRAMGRCLQQGYCEACSVQSPVCSTSLSYKTQQRLLHCRRVMIPASPAQVRHVHTALICLSLPSGMQ